MQKRYKAAKRGELQGRGEKRRNHQKLMPCIHSTLTISRAISSQAIITNMHNKTPSVYMAVELQKATWANDEVLNIGISIIFVGCARD